ADEAAFVQQLAWQPVGVGPHPTDRPEHGLGRGRRLSGTPVDSPAGYLAAREAIGERGAMARMQTYAQLGQPAVDAPPNPRMVIGQRAVAREIQVDSLVWPRGCQVDGAGDRGRAAAHHDD